MAEGDFVPDFDVKSDSSEDDSPAPKRRRGPNRSWLQTAQFPTAQEAEQSLSEKGIWKKAVSRTSYEGRKIEYRCTEGLYRKQECPVGLYLLYHATNLTVSMFETECGHSNHEQQPQRGLSVDVSEYVKTKFEDVIRKREQILTLTRRNKVTEPPKAKLVNFLKSLRREKFGETTTICANEIKEWCVKNECLSRLMKMSRTS